jgi:NAD(P)-dependent dehydrogenase (short-subunit alcohol dehydrogenase family)
MPPAFDLAGHVVIVTGASSGLGLRFAQVLAGAGATVYAAARRADRLAALAATDARVRPIACDLSTDDGRARLVDIACAESGHVDVLVNNAGVSGPLRIEEESTAVLGDVLNLNVVAAFQLCRLAGERMNPAGGSIVNVASVLGLVAGYPIGSAAYSASKGALIALTRELAAQWGGRNIRVNALAPGWFRTEMTEELFSNESSSRFVARNTMLNRPGRAEELDGALLFLASAAASYVTGQVLVVDGGWAARLRRQCRRHINAVLAGQSLIIKGPPGTGKSQTIANARSLR